MYINMSACQSLRSSLSQIKSVPILSKRVRALSLGSPEKYKRTNNNKWLKTCLGRYCPFTCSLLHCITCAEKCIFDAWAVVYLIFPLIGRLTVQNSIMEGGEHTGLCHLVTKEVQPLQPVHHQCWNKCTGIKTGIFGKKQKTHQANHQS